MLNPENIWNNETLVNILKQGGIAVMPTDTVYGIVAKAEDALAVENVYQVRNRSGEKPCIILIGEVKELEKFSIILTGEQKDKLKEYWPGPVSVILDCLEDKFKYLHRGTKTLAFRLPKDENLIKLLLDTGPLIAPSANREGEPIAKNIAEAKKYFGPKVDFYLSGGERIGSASKLLQLNKDGTTTIIRK